MQRRFAITLGIVIGFVSIPACTTLGLVPAVSETRSSDVLDRVLVTDDRSMGKLMADISPRRVTYIGETHHRYDHHLNQLAVIERLHRTGVDFAVGVEFFQRPYQQHLDAYVAGEIDEKSLLKRTGYYTNWGYDFRLYRPIVEFAREHGIALVALNAPAALVSQVSGSGFDGLADEWKSMLPEIQVPADAAYRRRLQQVFEMHPSADQQFDRFVQVQLLWDEFMADSAASFLERNPDRSLVVLAGSGHVAGGSGIPQRVYRRVPEAYSVVVSAGPEPTELSNSDHVLLAEGGQLPTAGRLGLSLREGVEGVMVQRWTRDPAGGANAVRPGDLISYIAGEPIRSVEDVRLAMLDRLPGEQVWVELARKGAGGKPVRVATVIELI